jgi:hypothetical protein
VRDFFDGNRHPIVRFCSADSNAAHLAIDFADLAGCPRIVGNKDRPLAVAQPGYFKSKRWHFSPLKNNEAVIRGMLSGITFGGKPKIVANPKSRGRDTVARAVQSSDDPSHSHKACHHFCPENNRGPMGGLELFAEATKRDSRVDETPSHSCGV